MSQAAFSVISHDRTFLNRLTKSCLWLDRGTMRRAEIGFGGFEAWTEAVYAERDREKIQAFAEILETDSTGVDEEFPAWPYPVFDLYPRLP